VHDRSSMTKFFKLTKLDDSIAFIPADRLLRIESEPNASEVSLFFEEDLQVKIRIKGAGRRVNDVANYLFERYQNDEIIDVTPTSIPDVDKVDF